MSEARVGLACESAMAHAQRHPVRLWQCSPLLKGCSCVLLLAGDVRRDGRRDCVKCESVKPKQKTSKQGRKSIIFCQTSLGNKASYLPGNPTCAEQEGNAALSS